MKKQTGVNNKVIKELKKVASEADFKVIMELVYGVKEDLEIQRELGCIEYSRICGIMNDVMINIRLKSAYRSSLS